MNEGRSNIDPGEKKSWIAKLTHMFRSTPQTREDISDLLTQAKDNKLIDDDEFIIIGGAMEVSDIQVREVMIPRSQMICVKADAPIEQFLPDVVSSGHSRIPVIGETTDDILGILHAKDLLPLVLEQDHSDFDFSKYLRKAHKVPESKRLNKLLQEFRETRNHMAIVIDEYGGVSGLITIEDVLEEIVGEIEDEFDVETDATIREIAENDYIIKAHTTIEEFNRRFSASLDDSEFDTIAGLVSQQLGHVPRRNETVMIDKYKFRILHADNRRLHLLRLFVQPEVAA